MLDKTMGDDLVLKNYAALIVMGCPPEKKALAAMTVEKLPRWLQPSLATALHRSYHIALCWRAQRASLLGLRWIDMIGRRVRSAFANRCAKCRSTGRVGMNYTKIVFSEPKSKGSKRLLPVTPPCACAPFG